MLYDAQIQVAGDADVKRACMAAENVDVAAGHRRMLPILILGCGKNRGQFVGGLPWLKGYERHPPLRIAEVLRLRATSLLFA